MVSGIGAKPCGKGIRQSLAWIAGALSSGRSAPLPSYKDEGEEELQWTTLVQKTTSKTVTPGKKQGRDILFKIRENDVRPQNRTGRNW